LGGGVVMAERVRLVNTEAGARASLAFRNLVTALDRVFPVQWAEERIWLDSVPHDFEMLINVYGLPGAAYVNATATWREAESLAGAGFIGVSVPVAQGDWFGPDSRPRESARVLVGTVEENREYQRGALGMDVDDIVGLLQILRRYYDQQPEFR
jgi:hypothetical protein